MMNQYTVLLLRPEYNTNGRTDTYMALVNTENVAAARVAAQQEAVFIDRDGDYDDLHPADYEVLLVIEGWHMDIKELE